MLILKSPAKINLFLQILEKRPDGYHQLASLFQSIDLCDTLQFLISSHDHLECTDPLIPNNNSNLIWKAANLFRKKTEMNFGVHIKLDKRIPIEAGLGGGSSNAATTFWALNELTGKKISTLELMKWGAEIGSDVPFFLSSGTAYCTGRGEIVESLQPLQKQSFWIAKPQQSLSTALVYKNVNLSNLRVRDPKETLQKFSVGEAYYFNDLEDPAFRVLPELQSFRSSLESLGFSKVMLSGSGSAFICIGNGEIPETLGAFRCKASSLNRSSDSWY